MRKITVNKNDEAALVVEKIIAVDDNEVALSIPRFSHLAESPSNFQLIRREADSLGKSVSVESVDDRVVQMAETAGLKATNPFFSKNNKRQISDIVVSSPKKKASFLEKNKGISEDRGEVEAQLDSINLPPLDLEKPKRKSFSFPNLFKAPARFLKSIFKRLFKFSWKIFILIAIAGILTWVAVAILPRAEVKIVAKKTQWSYSDSILADKSAKSDSSALTIPAQVFSPKKNMEMKFAATGKKNVEKKASGKITVYNSYSSDPQPLVATTRFMTPEGKVFRLVSGIIVPGAKIVEGKIVPSSIDASVVADQPGPDYNIGPVKLFTIPGLRGSPKYQAFYGESKDAMAGGFIGEMAYPTTADISSAKDEIGKTLEDILKTEITSSIPPGIKILDDARTFAMLSQTVNQDIDADSKFSVFAEAQMSAIAFKEEDLLKVLVKRATEEKGEDFEVTATNLKYGLSRPDYKNGKMSFLVDFSATLRQKIDVEALKSKILGKSEVDLKSMVFSLPGLESATISLWPMWVGKVPNNSSKVTIKID